MVEEARLENVGSGLAPVSEVWFVVNVRDAAWLTNDAFGARCVFWGGMPVQGEERPLRAWDFVHCPPGTAHAFVGAGDGPCVIFMTGARTREKDIVYPRSDQARRYRAGAETETHSAAEAYASYPHWQPERPDPKGMPWA